MNPFLYQKSQHRRKLNPRSYSYYTSYKPFLKQEFGSQCVYCRLPDGIKGQDNFGVDHYRPKSVFPELATNYSNLFYSCNCCNRRKGDFWPTPAELKAERFIPNPCDHVMFQHLRYRSARVETHSAAGEQAEQKLMLNDADSFEYRKLVLGLIAMVEEKKDVLRETIVAIGRQTPADPEQQRTLEREKRSAQDQLQEVESYLLRLTGGVLTLDEA